MQISAIALQGLNQAQAQVDQAAGRLASIGADTSQADVDTAGLSDAAVALLAWKNAYAGDIQLLKVADKMQRQAIDLLA
jgi:hypothetical protein